jgi:CubicO group peptidase (beta-lactamase class C family)
MTRSIRTLCFALAASLLLARAVAARTPAIDPLAVDAIVQASLEAWQVPGASVAIVRGDEVVYLKGFGVKELGKPDPVTPQTLFAIGSTTKAFTTTAIGILVDEGKMSWDDPVRKHLPSFRLSDPLADSGVTLRDIVSHRTGLSRNDLLWYASPWDRDEIIRKVGFVRLSRPFRSTYQYQNIMFLTAGQAVARAAGTTWEDFVKKRIFDPLGMTGANFSTLEVEKAPDRASPHRKDKQDRLEVIPWRNIDNVGPAGSINAGARDLAQWLRMQLGGGTFEGKKIVSAATLAETHTPQTVVRMEGATRAYNPDTNIMTYGLGWTVRDYRGHLLVSHGGAIDGFRAHVGLIPEAKVGIALLSNLGGTQMPESALNNLVDLVLGLPKKDWDAYVASEFKRLDGEAKKRRKEREDKRHKDTKPSRELAAYCGAYEDPGYGTATISVVNGALVLEWSRFRAGLEHFHFDTFSVKEERLEDEAVVFSLGADGEVAQMSFAGVDFKKVKPKAEPRT